MVYTYEIKPYSCSHLQRSARCRIVHIWTHLWVISPRAWGTCWPYVRSARSSCRCSTAGRSWRAVRRASSSLGSLTTRRSWGGSQGTWHLSRRIRTCSPSIACGRCAWTCRSSRGSRNPCRSLDSSYIRVGRNSARPSRIFRAWSRGISLDRG